MQTVSRTISDVMQVIYPPTRRSHFGLLQQRAMLITFALIMSIFIAACGGSAAEPAGTEDTSAPQEEPAAPQEEGSEEEADTSDELPGEEEFGLTMEELLQAIDNAETQIAQCMNDAGFEYVAVDANTVREAMSADKALPGLTEEQFYNQYGYGISTLYTGQAPQLSDVSTPATIGLGEQNVAIFQSLSPTDQEAYNQTLFGDHADTPLAVALELEDFSRTSGCTRTAIEAVFPADTLSVSYTNPKDALIDNDARVVEAFGKYAECIKEAGFDINHSSEIRPLITEQLDEIAGGAPVEALSAEAQAALAELQEFERALSAASFACEMTHVEPAKEEVEEELFGES